MVKLRSVGVLTPSLSWERNPDITRNSYYSDRGHAQVSIGRLFRIPTIISPNLTGICTVKMKHRAIRVSSVEDGILTDTVPVSSLEDGLLEDEILSV